MRIVFGVSAVGGFDTLQTRRSPSHVWEANISDFCLDDEACQASETMGEGERWVVRVCKMVKLGCKVARRMVPFL